MNDKTESKHTIEAQSDGARTVVFLGALGQNVAPTTYAILGQVGQRKYLMGQAGASWGSDSQGLGQVGQQSYRDCPTIPGRSHFCQCGAS